jgi:hypothetical protein
MSIPEYQSNRQDQIEEIRTGALNRFWTAFLYRWLYGCKHAARYEMQMGWERLTNTGDYTPGGHFDTIYEGWRDPDGADIGHGRIRSPRAAHIDHAGVPDDRRYQQTERATDDDRADAGEGKLRAMEIPLFLAEAEPLVDRRAE